MVRGEKPCGGCVASRLSLYGSNGWLHTGTYEGGRSMGNVLREQCPCTRSSGKYHLEPGVVASKYRWPGVVASKYLEPGS